MSPEDHRNPDAEILDEQGGPGAVARKLGYSHQRVHNWYSRGIPAQVVLDHPDVFEMKLKAISKHKAEVA